MVIHHQNHRITAQMTDIVQNNRYLVPKWSFLTKMAVVRPFLHHRNDLEKSTQGLSYFADEEHTKNDNLSATTTIQCYKNTT